MSLQLILSIPITDDNDGTHFRYYVFKKAEENCLQWDIKILMTFKIEPHEDFYYFILSYWLAQLNPTQKPDLLNPRKYANPFGGPNLTRRPKPIWLDLCILT